MAKRNSLQIFVCFTAWWFLFRVAPTLSFASRRQRIWSIKPTASASSRFRAPHQASIVLYSFLEQRPGENDIAFIKRITTEQPTQEDQQQPGQETTNSTTTGPITGKYQRIEEWDEQRKASGVLAWEEKVQFEGQQLGNQIKQDSILRRHIGTFF
jgi:hypothetical protein